MKNILFVRHGESTDDLDNQLGGWGDFHLTNTGKEQLAITANKISELDINFDVILSSPLLRAHESAEIISNIINVPLKVFPYVKEMNRNGILSAMNRDKAAEEYPDEYKKLMSNEYVLGSERVDDFQDRIKESIRLIELRKEENIIILTHGNFIRHLSKMYLDKETKHVGDGGFFLTELYNNNLKFKFSDNIDYQTS